MDPELIEIVEYMQTMGVEKFVYQDEHRRVEVAFSQKRPAVGQAIPEAYRATEDKFEQDDEEILFWSSG